MDRKSVGAGAALVLNSVVFVAANAMLTGSIQTAQSRKTPTDLRYLAVAAACVIAMLVGAAVLWGLGRFTRLGLQAWSVLAAAITLFVAARPHLDEGRNRIEGSPRAHAPSHRRSSDLGPSPCRQSGLRAATAKDIQRPRW